MKTIKLTILVLCLGLSLSYAIMMGENAVSVTGDTMNGNLTINGNLTQGAGAYTTSLSTLTVNGNVTVTGTVDGVDISTVTFGGTTILATTNTFTGGNTFQSGTTQYIGLDVLNAGGTSLLHVSQSGKIGIGSNVPNQTLLVGTGAGSHNIQVYSGNANAGAVYFGDALSGAGVYAGAVQYDHGGNRMEFYTNSVESMRILSNGYVTVFGASDPAASSMFDVAHGSITVRGTNAGLRVGTILTATIEGNVGIGTVTPTAKLHVNSSVYRIDTSSTITTATDPGNAGDVRWDANYVYYCISTDVWKRAALSTWP